MGGGFNKRGHIDTSRVYNNLEVVEIFQQSNWLVYFDKLQGYDDKVALEFALNFQNI